MRSIQIAHQTCQVCRSIHFLTDSHGNPHRQKDKVKAIALATSTNFEKSLGPSVPPSASWKLSPPPRPKPDLTAALADRPVPDWVPASYDGEILPLTRRLLVLNPRGGFPDDGVCDAWNGFRGGERIDATYLALMADIMPSMSDTLLRNGGPYDGHEFQRRAEQWAEEKPGVPLFIKTNSVAEVSFVHQSLGWPSAWSPVTL